jgi:hypothetical protein
MHGCVTSFCSVDLGGKRSPGHGHKGRHEVVQSDLKRFKLKSSTHVVGELTAKAMSQHAANQGCEYL